MTKLPSVTIEPLHFSDLFFNFRNEEGEFGTLEVANEFIQLCGLEEQVSPDDLVKDFNSRE